MSSQCYISFPESLTVRKISEGAAEHDASLTEAGDRSVLTAVIPTEDKLNA